MIAGCNSPNADRRLRVVCWWQTHVYVCHHVWSSISSLSRILYYSYHETHLPDLFNHPDISTTSILSGAILDEHWLFVWLNEDNRNSNPCPWICSSGLHWPIMHMDLNLDLMNKLQMKLWHCHLGSLSPSSSDKNQIWGLFQSLKHDWTQSVVLRRAAKNHDPEVVVTLSGMEVQRKTLRTKRTSTSYHKFFQATLVIHHLKYLDHAVLRYVSFHCWYIHTSSKYREDGKSGRRDHERSASVLVAAMHDDDT
jgi:hypothetical protein